MKKIFVFFVVIMTTSAVTVFAQCGQQPCPAQQQPATQLPVFNPELTPLEIPPGGISTTAYLKVYPGVKQFLKAFIYVSTPQGVVEKSIDVKLVSIPSNWDQEFLGNTPAGYTIVKNADGIYTRYYTIPKDIKILIVMIETGEIRAFAQL